MYLDDTDPTHTILIHAVTAEQMRELERLALDDVDYAGAVRYARRTLGADWYPNRINHAELTRSGALYVWDTTRPGHAAASAMFTLSAHA